MRPARYLAVVGALGVLTLGLAAVGAYELADWQHDVVTALMLVAGVVYAAAAWFLWRAETRVAPQAQRRALLVVIGVAVLARGLLLPAPPVSTDIYRYVWDGRVQAAGINPYRYRPADAEVAFLRDPTVYPQINRAATAVTIYPPLAQMIFLGVTRIANSVTGMKAAMVAFDLVTLAALAGLLSGCGMPATRLVFYAWHPLPLFEFAGSGHIDAAAISLMVLACLLAQRQRLLCAGALLGAAALVKFFPAVIAPALYRRWGWRFPAAMLAVMGLLYLPYLGVGTRVLGFLAGYADEEGLTNGSGFFALNLLGAAVALPRWSTAAYLAAGGAVLAGVGVVSLRATDGEIPRLAAALLLLALFTLWLSPHLAWYFTWFVPFLCFKRSWALVYLSVAAPLLYDNLWSAGPLALQAALYAPCAVMVVLELWFSTRRSPLESVNDGRLERPRHAG